MRQQHFAKTEIWGHRGAYNYAPENTLTSFQLAADMGADGVEFDIQLTKDGQIVVIHDETLERVSNGRGYVKDYSLAELKKLNFNKRGVTEPKLMEIPTLNEALELLKPTNLGINIELKTGIVFYEGIELKALESVEAFKMLERVIWSSFNHYSVQKIKQLKRTARTALLCGGGVLATGEQCEKAGAEALHCDVRQMRHPSLIEDCCKRGIKVRAYTANTREDLQYAYANGIDAIFTNDISLAKEELAQAAGL